MFCFGRPHSALMFSDGILSLCSLYSSEQLPFPIKKQKLSLGGATCFKDAENNLWLFRDHLEKCSKIGCYDIIVKVRYTVNIFLFTHSESSMFLLCHIYTETHSTL